MEIRQIMLRLMFICQRYVHVSILKLSRHENVGHINLFNKLNIVKGFSLIIPKIITINCILDRVKEIRK